MVYGVTLVLALVLVGGAIAYVGDKIGMKVGRKKLSLFGLRPKYTSIIITIVTGILIAGASLGVLTIASSDVRTALFHMKEIQTALATSEVRYQASQQRLMQVQEQLIAQEEKAAKLAHQIQQKTREYEELNKQLMEVAKQRDAAKLELESARQQAEELAGKYEKLQADYQVTMSEYDKLRSDYQAMEAAYARIEDQYEAALAQYEAAKEDLAKTQAALDETRSVLDIEKQRLEDMKEINQLFQAKIEELKQTEQEMKNHIQALTEEYSTLVARQNELIKEKQKELERIKSGNFVYQANEILLATVIEGGMSPDQIRNDLIVFLNRANQLALERGVMKQSESKAALIIDNDHFQKVVDYLSKAQGKYVVRALASSNTLVGEPVEVRLVYLPNTLIYRKGDVILTRDIDLSYPVNVEDEIAEMLSEIGEIGIARGMITYEDGTLGTALPGDEFIATLREVRKHKGLVQIQAVAAHNIWTGIGPMTVELRVKPLSEVDKSNTGGDGS